MLLSASQRLNSQAWSPVVVFHTPATQHSFAEGQEGQRDLPAIMKSLVQEHRAGGARRMSGGNRRLDFSRVRVPFAFGKNWFGEDPPKSSLENKNGLGRPGAKAGWLRSLPRRSGNRLP